MRRRFLAAALALAWTTEVVLAEEGRGTFTGFDRSLNTRAYGYTVVRDAPASAGTSAERFEVRPGDCARTAGWDDCASDRERSELSERAPYTALGEETWYAFSLYLPPDFPNVFPAKTALGQFHQRNTRSPPILFQHGPGGYVLDVNQTRRGSHLLIPEAELRGRWHAIVARARWSMGEDGFVEVFVNGASRINLAGPNTTRPDPVYFKYGVYRSFLGRFKADRGLADVPAQTAYFADVRKGFVRADVDRR